MESLGRFDNDYMSRCAPFPVGPARVSELIRSYVVFYPVYDSYLRIAMGKPIRLNMLVDKLRDWLEQEAEEDGEAPPAPSLEELEAASAAAGLRVTVRTALHWQVLQKDNWRRVSCGRCAHDGVVLHVDHITPRSLGGSDLIENLQTLCLLCNLGKSNRDATDLRLGAPGRDALDLPLLNRALVR